MGLKNSVPEIFVNKTNKMAKFICSSMQIFLSFELNNVKTFGTVLGMHVLVCFTEKSFIQFSCYLNKLLP